MKNGFKNWRTSIGDIERRRGIWSSRDRRSQQARDRRLVLRRLCRAYAGRRDRALFTRRWWRSRPVTDLELLKSEAQDYTNSESSKSSSAPALTLSKDRRCSTPSDQSAGAALPRRSRSQCRYRAIARRWRGAEGGGQQVELVRFNGLDHQLDDSTARDRHADARSVHCSTGTIGHVKQKGRPYAGRPSCLLS